MHDKNKQAEYMRTNLFIEQKQKIESLEIKLAVAVKERDELAATNAVLVEALEYYAGKFDETSGVGEVAHKILSNLAPLTKAAAEVLREVEIYVKKGNVIYNFPELAYAIRAYNAAKEGK